MSVGSGWIDQQLIHAVKTPGNRDRSFIEGVGRQGGVRVTRQVVIWLFALTISVFFHTWVFHEDTVSWTSKPEISGVETQVFSIQLLTSKNVQPKLKVTSQTVEDIIGVSTAEKNLEPEIAKEEVADIKQKAEKISLLKKASITELAVHEKKLTTRKVQVVPKSKPQKIESKRIVKKAGIIEQQSKLVELKDDQKKQKPGPMKTQTKIIHSEKQYETYESLPLVANPKYLKPPTSPRYPRLSRRKGQQGTSIFRVRVSDKGVVSEVRLFESSGYQLLDKAAMSAIKKWEFEPANLSGMAMAAWIQVPVKFQLKN